jgi:hypothetical protein
MRPYWAIGALLLAGCTTSQTWTKPGADATDTAGALQECRAAADIAVAPEAAINQDILATRQTDWQRSQIGGIAIRSLGEETSGRADRIIAACMRAKGFTQSK